MRLLHHGPGVSRAYIVVMCVVVSAGTPTRGGDVDVVVDVEPFACIVTPRADYFGSDLPNNGGLVTETVHGCSVVCVRHPECQFYSFNHQTYKCYLKTAEAGKDLRKDDKSLFSAGDCLGIKPPLIQPPREPNQPSYMTLEQWSRSDGSVPECVRINNTEFKPFPRAGMSPSFPIQPISVKTIDQCAEICNGDPACKGWNLKKNRAWATSFQCFLLTSWESIVAASGLAGISGTKCEDTSVSRIGACACERSEVGTKLVDGGVVAVGNDVLPVILAFPSLSEFIGNTDTDGNGNANVDGNGDGDGGEEMTESRSATQRNDGVGDGDGDGGGYGGGDGDGDGTKVLSAMVWTALFYHICPHCPLSAPTHGFEGSKRTPTPKQQQPQQQQQQQQQQHQQQHQQQQQPPSPPPLPLHLPLNTPIKRSASHHTGDWKKINNVDTSQWTRVEERVWSRVPLVANAVTNNWNKHDVDTATHTSQAQDEYVQLHKDFFNRNTTTTTTTTDDDDANTITDDAAELSKRVTKRATKRVTKSTVWRAVALSNTHHLDRHSEGRQTIPPHHNTDADDSHHTQTQTQTQAQAQAQSRTQTHTHTYTHTQTKHYLKAQRQWLGSLKTVANPFVDVREVVFSKLTTCVTCQHELKSLLSHLGLDVCAAAIDRSCFETIRRYKLERVRPQASTCSPLITPLSLLPTSHETVEKSVFLAYPKTGTSVFMMMMWAALFHHTCPHCELTLPTTDNHIKHSVSMFVVDWQLAESVDTSAWSEVERIVWAKMPLFSHALSRLWLKETTDVTTWHAMLKKLFVKNDVMYNSISLYRPRDKLVKSASGYFGDTGMSHYMANWDSWISAMTHLNKNNVNQRVVDFDKLVHCSTCVSELDAVFRHYKLEISTDALERSCFDANVRTLHPVIANKLGSMVHAKQLRFPSCNQ